MQAVRLLDNANVSDAIKQLRKRQAERLDISREKIVNDIAHLAEQSAINDRYSDALKANELILKAQGYLIERSMNVSVDITQQHLDALQSYTDQRIDEALKRAERDERTHVTDIDADDTEHLS